jgi:hypothetical protein
VVPERPRPWFSARPIVKRQQPLQHLGTLSFWQIRFRNFNQTAAVMSCFFLFGLLCNGAASNDVSHFYCFT